MNTQETHQIIQFVASQLQCRVHVCLKTFAPSCRGSFMIAINARRWEHADTQSCIFGTIWWSNTACRQILQLYGSRPKTHARPLVVTSSGMGYGCVFVFCCSCERPQKGGVRFAIGLNLSISISIYFCFYLFLSISI